MKNSKQMYDFNYSYNGELNRMEIYYINIDNKVTLYNYYEVIQEQYTNKCMLEDIKKLVIMGYNFNPLLSRID